MPGVPARSLPLIAWAALLFAACTLEPGEGKFVCEADDDCPKGWECQRKRCYIGDGNGDDTSRESSQETATATADTDTGTADTDTGTPDSDTGTETETDTLTVPDTDSSTGSETLNGTDLSTETETGTTSTDTGMDTGTDTVPSDTATSTCECELGSGPCCKEDCQLYTRVEQYTCSIEAVLSCKTSNCGGVVEQVSSIVVCDGKSAQCDGPPVTQKENVTTCQASQKCVEDGTDASCVEDTGCP